jgi:hypothetical protein
MLPAAWVAVVVIGIAIARSSIGFERPRGTIDRDEAIQIPQSSEQSLLPAALAISVAISCIYLVVF